MPLDYSVDLDARIVRMRCSDPLHEGDVVAVLERQIREGYWQFGTLVDARLSGLNAASSGALFGHVRELVAQHGPNGPVALVTRKPEFAGGGHVISTRGAEIAMKFEVFWDVDEATAWLLTQLS